MIKIFLMKTNKKYLRVIKRQFGYMATWLPNKPIALGDIGIQKGNYFRRIGNINSRGISFSINEDNNEGEIEHFTEGAVSITTKASGSAKLSGSSLAKADAGITIKFSKENAILFKAKGCTSPTIQNQIDLGEKILNLYKKGEWNKDWSVITEVVNAKSGVVLVSSSANGIIELKVKSDISANNIDIADGNFEGNALFSKDVSTKIITDNPFTPLFKSSKVRSRILGPSTFEISKSEMMMNTTNGSNMDLVTPAMARNNDKLIFFDEVPFDENFDNF